MTLSSQRGSAEKAIRKLEIAQVRIPQKNIKHREPQNGSGPSVSGVQIAPGLVKP
jgi:hypothetical protein